MLLGFLDRQGRAYDLNFRTLKRRLRDSDGLWEAEPGESMGPGTSIEGAVFLMTPKPHLLMRPTSGLASASDRRLLFLAADGIERSSEEPTTFNVSLQIPKTAVDHMFLEVGGREIVEIRRDEIRETTESRGELTLLLDSTWIGGGSAATSFAFVLRPKDDALAAVAPLGLSPPGRRNP